MKRRIISIVLTLALLCTLLPAGVVQAAEEDWVAYPVEGGDLYFDPTTGEIVDCDEDVTVANIPDEINSVPVTYIGYGAFAACNSLTSVSIPASVIGIDNAAFAGCSLTNVEIPASVTSIDWYAFAACDGLAAINVAAENPRYSSDQGVLLNKTQTELILCPNGFVGAYTIPVSVTSIGYGAFWFCSSLTSVTIPNSVTSIGSLAFSNCSSLTSVTIPASVTGIDQGVFEYCSSLTSVAIPASVISIETSAFSGCSNLMAIDVAAENILYSSNQGVLFNKAQTELILCPQGLAGAYTVPASVTRIDEYAFEFCNNLTSVAISEGVTKIDFGTFSYCNSLTSVVIPDNVTSIYSEAFFGCDDLKDVYYAGREEQWKQIHIEDGNEPLMGAKIHYNSITPDVPDTPSFTDVPEGAFYTEAVSWAVAEGITNGTAEGKFSPMNNCTRGQIVTFLWRANGKPEPTQTSHPFTDVSPDAYYYDAMLWAVEQGVTNGVTATTFGPNNPCTRGQAVTFLYRAMGGTTSTAANAFTDVQPGAYYYDAVLWAVEQGIANGTTATTFAPDRTCTRGHIVTFLFRGESAKESA